jgi:protein-S-isoprenylcysteine O-methyltransferase Ste14
VRYPDDPWIKFAAMVLSWVWGFAEQTFAIRNRGRTGSAAIRLHAIRTLARHFTSRVTLLEDHALVREGAYRWIRHPSYLGQILILVGFGALLANAVSLIAAPLLTTVALLLRIRVEERALAEHFGQAYEDYRRVTARLLPFVW